MSKEPSACSDSDSDSNQIFIHKWNYMNGMHACNSFTQSDGWSEPTDIAIEFLLILVLDKWDTWCFHILLHFISEINSKNELKSVVEVNALSNWKLIDINEQNTKYSNIPIQCRMPNVLKTMLNSMSYEIKYKIWRCF